MLNQKSISEDCKSANMSSDEEVYTQKAAKRVSTSSLSSLSPTPTSKVRLAPGTPSSLSDKSPVCMSSLSSCGKINLGNYSQRSSSPTTPSPSPSFSPLTVNLEEPEGPEEKLKVSTIKVEFLDSEGVKIDQTRYSKHPEIVELVSFLVRATYTNYRNAVVSKLCESTLFKDDIHGYVINRISKQFDSFIASDDCPLRNPNLMSEIEHLSEFDFGVAYNKCKDVGGDLMTSLSQICFGVDLESLDGGRTKYFNQRLLAILAISAFSRSQKVNVLQKLLGEFFKLRSTGKQPMQLLHRLGLSMVTMSLRADLDVIGKHFLNEIQMRREEIETWFKRRKMIEKVELESKLRVKFQQDKKIPAIVDLGDDCIEIKEKLDLYQPDEYVLDLFKENGNDAKATMEVHLDSRPKLYDVSYDNIDITVNSSEYLMGQQNNSIHWCSSIVVKDVIDAKKVNYKDYARSILSYDFEENRHHP